MEKQFEKIVKNENLNFDLKAVLQKFAVSYGIILQSYEIKQIFNRPFSIVVNLKLIAGEPYHIYLKIYKPEGFKANKNLLHREYQITRYWFEQFKSHKYFHTIEPLWIDDELRVIITKETSGINLLSVLEKKIRFLPSPQNIDKTLAYLNSAGKWLAYFQQQAIKPDIPYLDDSVRINLDYFSNHITKRMDRMVANPKIGFDAHMRQELLDTIRRLWDKVGDHQNHYCVSHSDLSLSNILVKDKHVTVLDFHRSEINSPFKDLSRLYHQLFLLSFKPEYQNRIIQKLQKALLAGWGNAQADEDPLFKLYFLMHQINHMGKISRYWEHTFFENVYNRWVVKNSLKQLKEFIAHESESKN